MATRGGGNDEAVETGLRIEGEVGEEELLGVNGLVEGETGELEVDADEDAAGRAETDGGDWEVGNGGASEGLSGG